MRIGDYGIELSGGIELVYLHSDPKHGRWFLLKGKKQEVTIRVTKSGLLRVSRPIKATTVSIWAQPPAEAAPE